MIWIVFADFDIGHVVAEIQAGEHHLPISQAIDNELQIVQTERARIALEIETNSAPFGPNQRDVLRLRPSGLLSGGKQVDRACRFAVRQKIA